MQSVYDTQLSQALDLHRNGRINEAKEIYSRLLHENGSDANLIGLLGMVAVQQGNRAEAETLWMRSLRLECEPWVYIRNINNLAATLFEDGRDQAAAQLLESAEIPSWRGDQPPDDRQIKWILSLTICLQRAALTRKARPLLEAVGAVRPNDRDAQLLLADARLADMDFSGALEILERHAGSDDLWIVTARLQCERELGLRAAAEADYRKVLQLASVHVCEGLRDDRKTVLVINSGDAMTPTSSAFDFHFHANYPSQVAQVLKDEFNFASIFVDADVAKLNGLKPHLVLNNMVNAEVLNRDATFKYDLAALADSFGVPVINHPLQAALTTRQRVAFWLKDLDNVLVPRTMRFRADGTTIDSQVSLLEAELGYPLIIRTTSNQRGIGMEKIDDRRALRQELLSRIGQQLYAHPFIDSRAGAEFFRKFRAAVVGDEIIPVRLDFSDSWKVSGRILPDRKKFYRQRPQLLDEEKRLLAAPNDVVTDGVMHALRDIRAKIPLDIFGIDFDVSRDGRIVFYEANASMYLLQYLAPDDADLFHPVDVDAHLRTAIKAHLQRRMAGSSAPPGFAADAGSTAARQ
jgi:hypothetical protein